MDLAHATKSPRVKCTSAARKRHRVAQCEASLKAQSHLTVLVQRMGNVEKFGNTVLHGDLPQTLSLSHCIHVSTVLVYNA